MSLEDLEQNVSPDGPECEEAAIWMSTGQGWLMRLTAQLGRESDLQHGRDWIDKDPPPISKQLEERTVIVPNTKK